MAIQASLPRRYWRRGNSTHGHVVKRSCEFARRLSSISGVSLHHPPVVSRPIADRFHRGYIWLADHIFSAQKLQTKSIYMLIMSPVPASRVSFPAESLQNRRSKQNPRRSRDSHSLPLTQINVKDLWRTFSHRGRFLWLANHSISLAVQAEEREVGFVAVRAGLFGHLTPPRGPLRLD